MPAIGDRIPDATVMINTDDGPGRASSAELLGSGTVVLIGVPGAFTAVCTAFHLPGFVTIADPDAVFAKAMGLATDASSFGLGARSERYAAVLRDGVITSLDVEAKVVDHEVSTAEAVLAKL